MSVTNEGARLIEQAHVPDIFVSGLGEVEDLGGGCYRFIFFAKQTIGGREETVVVAKLVAPAHAVPPAILLAAKSIGLSIVTGTGFISGVVN